MSLKSRHLSEQNAKAKIEKSFYDALNEKTCYPRKGIGLL